ncbi:MAG: NifU family protein [Bdellovibrionales bacterium]|nr:NifU family protein [Bdellovibrionales bacterium]
MSSDIAVFYEATPNPHSMKFVITKVIADQPVNFANTTEAIRSPLALKIFGFPWAAGVYIGANFVTITKQEWVDWDILADPLSELIKEHLLRGEPVLLAGVEPVTTDEEDDSDDSPIVRQIKQILRDEIRPAVAMDGGDITFDRYEDGRVYLHMQGACAGCPSSTYTLKEGIETRMKELIPEIQEVVSV